MKGDSTMSSPEESDFEVGEIDMNNLMALKALARNKPRKTAGATVQSRVRGERSAARRDGRRIPIRSEREVMVPLNVDVPENVKAIVLKARSEYAMPIRHFVAEAILLYARKLEIEAAGGGDA